MTSTYAAKPGTLEAFTSGDCWALAVEFRRLTGFPLIFANPDPEQEGYWEHVGLLLQDRYEVLDVTGVSDVSDWLEKWRWQGSSRAVHAIVAWTNEEVEELVSDQERRFPDHNARALAKRLLNTFRIPTSGRKQRDALFLQPASREV